MKYYFQLCFLISIQVMAVAQQPANKTGTAAHTYKTFAAQKTRFGYHQIGKTKYLIERVPDSLISREDEAELINANVTVTSYYKGAVPCSGNIFAGEKRAEAKTHEAITRSQNFNTFDNFYLSGLLITDNKMRNYNPPITATSGSPRVKEEQVNVTIGTAYIYGIYRENDNDFHMIIGNGKTGAGMHILNAEISGLPVGASDPVLNGVRDIIIKHFGDLPCGDGVYKPVKAFIPIKITGSLFFDVDHGAGTVGFQNYKPLTAWEIHPITDIQFLDE